MAKMARLLPAYLVVGADELKRRSAITRLKGYLDEGLAAFNLDEISPTADTDPTGVISSLNTMPVGDSPRIVIIEPADKLPKPVSEAVVGYLKDPNPACTLLLSATTLAKSTRLYKAVAKVGPKAVIDCTPAARRDLPSYVQKLARSHGLAMDQDAARALVDRVGESTTMLDTQLRTLSALKGGRGQVTLADVEASVARVAEVKPWEFLDRLSERDVRRSLELYALLRGSSQVGLLTLVTIRIRELVCARALDARGEGGGVAQALGKQGWQVKNHVRWARGFAPGELERDLAACGACERALKGSADSDSALLSLIATICGGGGQSPCKGA
ncbi:MAG: DNA polymerase III subunit delta [Coriobacteriaceae bacterium]|uniref:DNA polymerase III subunit delta n=1 Tax=Tractidigestivibacter sp. TaxID=2847320 RepID=UPI002A8387F9|nr:DNA polymerase III subunit delta [Tractidigestivibacter sp.]MCI6548472.1 DNA polymerase III subunit delta [Coriobacteriaceae bacterium]MDY4535112.1 DNA polymerase III subunit delta [Tractidigestivibacter sp.]MDY5271523.1 DNA polymerase III subunit delta [Tractidigestivibacter sp.]